MQKDRNKNKEYAPAIAYLFMGCYVGFFFLLASALWSYGIFHGIISENGKDSWGEVDEVFTLDGSTRNEMSHDEQLYSNCAACHGVDGEGNHALKAPAIAGQSADYIKRQLVKFREGKRGTNVQDTQGQSMRPMAQILDKNEIESLSEYVGNLAGKKSEATIFGDPQRGKGFYALCSTCHGTDARGNDTMKAPSLVGLQDWYIVESIKKYREGIRGTHPEDIEGQQMRPMAIAIANEETISDIAAYINELKGL